MSDAKCYELIKKRVKIKEPSQIKKQSQEKKKELLMYLIQEGSNITQISRVTEIPRHILTKL